MKFHAVNIVLETAQRATMSTVLVIWDVIRAIKVPYVFKVSLKRNQETNVDLLP